MIRLLPTRRLALLLAIISPVWAFSLTPSGLAAAIAVTALVLLLAGADAAAIPGRRRLRVQRTLPASIGLSDQALAQHRIESDWPLPITVYVHDAFVPGVRRRDPPARASMPWLIGRARLPARGTAAFDTALIGQRRGEYDAPRVVLRITGPLGLMQRTFAHEPRGRIAVVPSFQGIRQYRLLTLQRRLREAGVRALRRRGEGSSFANLREYVEGDDPRHIDWKASARRGRLITREYAIEQGQTIMIAIDAGRMMTQLAGSISRFEHALAAASVLADVATRSGDHVGLLVFNDEVRAFVPPGRGALALRRIREAMVPLTANLREPDYAAAFRTLATRHRRRSLIVIFTDVVDPRASRSLIAHTVRSAVRHLPLVVALQNDALVAAALPAAGSEELFRHAAAEELLLEREAALARMRQAGVSVVDVSPRRAAVAVVNRYLELKARAAL